MSEPPAVVRLSAGGPDQPLRTGHVELVVDSERVTLELRVPAGPVTVETLLPILHGLSSLFADRAAARAEAAGRPASCRSGCASCCRHMVPLAPSEALALARLVDALPEPRRTTVRDRFAANIRTAGDVVERMPTDTREERLALAHAYFRFWIACPLLEDEACSIYPDRPLACREYLVSSPAENCLDLLKPKDQLELDANVLGPLIDFEAGGWVPMLFALRYRDESAGRTPPSHDAQDVLRGVISRFASDP